MKNLLLKFAGASLLALTLGTVSQADTITAIMGSGIPDDGWAVTTSSPTVGTSNSVQVALRARAEYGATLTHTAYDYYTVTGLLSPTRAIWNLDFSINSDTDGATGGLKNLTTYKYTLALVSGPSGTNAVLDPLTYFSDNSYGDNSTGQGAGVEDNSPANHNIAQNSENALFPWPGINPWAAGVYEFTLTALPLNPADHLPNPLASTTIWVNVVGVPDGGTTALLLGLGLVGMSFVARRRKQIQA